jgi:hypothetical protein
MPPVDMLASGQEIGGSLAGRQLADEEHHPADEAVTPPSDHAFGGRRRHAEWRDGVHRLHPARAREQPRTPVNFKDPLADADHHVHARDKALLEAGVEPAVQECQLRAQAAPAPTHPAFEVLHRALAPQLADAAVRRPPVVVMQAHWRGVDEAAVADRQ